jgi:putative nucleotidyltransferase with HDIG domain
MLELQECPLTPWARPVIDEQSTPCLMRRLPRVVIATFLVAVFPSLVVWMLRNTGVVSSALFSIALAALLSLAVCQAAGLYWERRRSTQDLLFADLMIWGWVRRWLAQRRLGNAISMLGLTSDKGGHSPIALSLEHRATLLEQIAANLEVRDPYTHGHSGRVARYASGIASQMGLSRTEVAKVRAAAAVHDVGKLETPIDVLHKPGALTDEEFELIKRHASDGARMVSILIEDEELTAMIRHHHERLDGTGYPSRLGGDVIPLGARIIAVADTFDAMTSNRPYRAAMPHKVAIDILRAEAGVQLDSHAVNAFLSFYFGRRPLGAFVALSNGGGRLMFSLVGGVTGASRGLAIGASTAALGTAAVAGLIGHPATSRPAGARASVAFHAGAPLAGSGAAGLGPGTVGRGVARHSTGGAGRSGAGAGSGTNATGSIPSSGRPPRATRTPQSPVAAGSPGGPTQTGGSPGGSPTTSPSSPANTPLELSANAGGSSGATTSVAATTSAAGSPRVAVSVPGAGSGVPGVSASVTPSSASASVGGAGGVGAGVSLGSTSSGLPGVGVSVGGN